MGIRIEIEGADASAIHKTMQDMLPASAGNRSLDDYTLQELIALVEKRAASEGYDLAVTLPDERKSPAEKRKAEARAKLRGDLEESLKETAAKAKEPEPEPEPEPEKPAKAKKGKTAAPVNGNGKAEDPEERKQRVIDKLVGLFNNGHKAEVNQILADHGNGAKTFSVIPADQFGPIEEAVSAIGG
jgi:hypothetical protein